MVLREGVTTVIVPDRRANASVSAWRCERADGALVAISRLVGHRLRLRVLLLVVTIAIGSTSDARAGEHDLPIPHIRTSDPHLRALIDQATVTSATVRALIDRITASDVIVFVTREPDPSVRADGRLNFMAAAGGFRYVIVRLKPMRRAAAIAMLAHELQHAAEIADAPSVVDEAALAREYERIGYRSHAAHGREAFDTKAAVETGRRVVEELMTPKTSAAD